MKYEIQFDSKGEYTMKLLDSVKPVEIKLKPISKVFFKVQGVYMDNEVYKFITHDWPNIVLASQFNTLDNKTCQYDVKWGKVAFLK